MRHGPPIIIRIIVIVALLSIGLYWLFVQRDGQAEAELVATGTIEVPEITISPELGGRVTEVLVAAGDVVTAQQPLIRFDVTLLQAQLAQAQAGLQTAQANYGMLAAGPTEVETAAAQAAVTRARTTLNALNEQLETAESRQREAEDQVNSLLRQIAEATTALAQAQGNVPVVAQAEVALAGLNGQLGLAERLQASTAAQVQLLQSQLTVAEATLDAAQAQMDVAQAGARPERLAAAQAQVEAAAAAVAFIQAQISRQTLIAPADGVILARTIEPGEVAAPGAALLILGRLNDLTITVYVPENRYGVIQIGQPAAITVDSFPGEQFAGTVRRIAGQAEFTPRNVQTAEGRASTVFAIELGISGGAGRLKPGMPADVRFSEGPGGQSGE